MKEERKRILKLVEEGKLSVEEALTLLEGLDDASKSKEPKQQDSVHEISTNVEFQEAKKEQSTHQKLQSTKDKIFEFVDTAFQKIKDFDLDFNFGHSVDISHIFQHGDAFLKEIDIDIANGSIRVLPGNERDVRIECHARIYRVENQDEARRSFLKDTIFAIEGEKLRFVTQQKWMKIDATVYIPADEYEHVKVRIFNGYIAGNGLCAKNCKVKTANGKINLDGVSCEKLEAETANGPITIVGSRIGEVDAETINGPIKLEGDFAEVDIQTFNGNVHCSLTGDRAERIIAKGATGSIELFIPEKLAVNGNLRTNLGGFTVDLEGIQIVDEKNEIAQKTMTFKPVNEEIRTVNLSAETKTGSISVRKSFGINLKK
ncbi:DUF4097 domain-containing protein [Bacillus canaveralius]|uniref:DUF4097 domain-containing protein n=1 Tax=Bacillus canaveralius TaxID=1403243 RepID=A0A2N5GQI4_9BACI|nr:DUF4097 domain-containing protein [Bacillus canaveralius]PLR85340.1 DUF4097 domain-containing protein [Bacillus canaveralius]PLR99340.1 DUF4097 domain-containing protein [Bacillus canaveralius]RSK48592.1 DUF4097 domain-containing protein [Bacillus canaveralius]